MAGHRAQLSPNEQTTLAKIVAGIAQADQLRVADVKRLIALGLVEVMDGTLTATIAGKERSQGLVGKPASARLS